MRRRGSVFFLTAVLLAVCFVLTGCAGSDNSSIQDFAPDLSVNIVVPYQTTAPTTAPKEVAPFTITGNGDVRMNNVGWVNEDFISVDGGGRTYVRLEPGDSGEAVRELQLRLKDLNYFTGDVSGVFDQATETAVKLFELTYGTMQTGVASEKMQALLFASTAPAYGTPEYEQSKSNFYETLQTGDVGSGVLLLQFRLMELGYPLTTASGRYDQETAIAVSLFYEAYGFKPNPVAVVAMQKELFNDNARRYTGPYPDEKGDTPSKNSLTTLSEGNIGTLVIQLQNRLIELGYLSGEATGTYDAATAQAVRFFQAAIGVSQTGVADAELQTQILSFSAPSYGAIPKANELTGYTLLQSGSSGDNVYALQERLVELGYADGTPNGKYGDATASAVRLFQRATEAAETGIATVATQIALFREDAPHYDPELENAERLYPYDIPMAPLSLGFEGDAVTYLQRRLAQLGYYRTDASGLYDNATAQAVADMQKVLCIPQTGEASVSFQQYLYSDAAPAPTYSLHDEEQSFETLSPGMMNETIVFLQRTLWELGYLDREAVSDSLGTYNEATVLAVVEAQIAMGYTDADGIASPEFQAFIFSRYNSYIKKK